MRTSAADMLGPTPARPGTNVVSLAREAAKTAFGRAGDAAMKAANYCDLMMKEEPDRAAHWLAAKEAWTKAATCQFNHARSL